VTLVDSAELANYGLKQTRISPRGIRISASCRYDSEQTMNLFG
jgi:hypothetical protein